MEKPKAEWLEVKRSKLARKKTYQLHISPTNVQYTDEGITKTIRHYWKHQANWDNKVEKSLAQFSKSFLIRIEIYYVYDASSMTWKQHQHQLVILISQSMCNEPFRVERKSWTTVRQPSRYTMNLKMKRILKIMMMMILVTMMKQLNTLFLTCHLARILEFQVFHQ